MATGSAATAAPTRPEAGRQFLHVTIHDRSRIAWIKLHPDKGQASAVVHLATAVAYYARLGITVRAVLTDNGSAYR